MAHRVNRVGSGPHPRDSGAGVVFALPVEEFGGWR
jgi:hypothetical protein